MSEFSYFIKDYKNLALERGDVPPLPLNVDQTNTVVQMLENGTSEEKTFAKDLLINRVSPGVDPTSKIKADFLGALATKQKNCDVISPKEAVFYLGSMLGGYNVPYLIEALKSSDTEVSKEGAKALKNTLLVYEHFDTISDLSASLPLAKEILQSWADAEWFLNKPALSERIKLCVLKIDGETNTDDLSPASDAFTRSDIPLHAEAMLKNRIPEFKTRIANVKNSGVSVVYVGDVVGTGSSRKSATNSIQWHFGDEIPFIPNKKTRGFVIGGIIAPIFFNTCEDSGALPIVADVSKLNEGDIIEVLPYEGKILKDGEIVSTFELSPNTIADEIRAGGRIQLIIGRALTNKARKFLKLGESDVFIKPDVPKATQKGFTLAQKIVGRACGVDGVVPGTYCEPRTTTVGSQDTTGAMTRDEIKELAALNFGADFVMQSFCHTAAYPKPSDISLQATLPDFITSRGGVALRPKDGVIHSWLNRFCLPDTLGTGGDSHTRFPIGISFPAGSGLVAFAAVTGSMPLNMPESVLVRFRGSLNPGVTLRDLVNAIPYYAIKQGLLTIEKKGKKNVFSGKILEIEGLENIEIEQAFEFSDASAERSSAGCVVKLDKEPIIRYLKSNIALMQNMIKNGYQSVSTLERRIKAMEEWIANPVLLEADKDANYHSIIDINLDEITEPILACPNDPDDVATLSEVLANPKRPHKVDEVFIGSCMTNIGHFRAFGEIVKDAGALPTRVWIVPPTKMDSTKLADEGYFSIFGAAGTRIEVPGCSLCMGNQARVRDGATVFSTSTRNFDNRMGRGAQVYLGSAELGAVCALLGKIPDPKEYLDIVKDKLNQDKIYTYLSFDKMEVKL
ncbi:MAG: bifunctional aconitate hydratase 2/2-methylisocitrate dehydratase [Helicobacter sp.]|nr:bifunctional aconitate hydratase 2/2-methylisocitrate dehydratase [Helicobacter sp.]